MSRTFNMKTVEQQNLQLFTELQDRSVGIFPSTRYQGSKYKLIKWINYHTQGLDAQTVLDAFGGTGSIGYMFKQRGKRVIYNDSLKFNHFIGLALIENQTTRLDDQDMEFILNKHPHVRYPTFIYDTFHDIYFTDEENQWLDVVVSNISSIGNRYKQALAYYALFQACISKRPYNLFHRKNLYLRLADVQRSFGNKKTWDTPFRDHFLRFVTEANKAVYDNGKHNQALHSDVFDLSIPNIDLVYIDPPYISARGVGVNYFDFYHFLEGIVFYAQWPQLIDMNSKHKKISNGINEWCKKGEIHGAFERLFNKFHDSILVVSYRDDGMPTINELVAMLKKIKGSVEIKKLDYKYVLSKEAAKEVLIIAQ